MRPHGSASFVFFTTRPPPRSTLFPYTTLFRSGQKLVDRHAERACHLHQHRERGIGLARFQIGDGRARQSRGLRERILSQLSPRSEEHTSELQSHVNLVCRLLLEKKKKQYRQHL